MRRLATAVSLLVLCAAGCADPGVPRPGDTVAPRIVQIENWTPGQRGVIYVLLEATDQSGNTRQLSFRASPSANPVAQIDFFDDGGQFVESADVELSERC